MSKQRIAQDIDTVDAFLARRVEEDLKEAPYLEIFPSLALEAVRDMAEYLGGFRGLTPQLFESRLSAFTKWLEENWDDVLDDSAAESQATMATDHAADEWTTKVSDDVYDLINADERIPEDRIDEILDKATGETALLDIMLTDEGWTNAFLERPEKWGWLGEIGIAPSEILPSGGGPGDELSNAVFDAVGEALVKHAIPHGLQSFMEDGPGADLDYEDPRQTRMFAGKTTPAERFDRGKRFTPRELRRFSELELMNLLAAMEDYEHEARRDGDLEEADQMTWEISRVNAALREHSAEARTGARKKSKNRQILQMMDQIRGLLTAQGFHHSEMGIVDSYSKEEGGEDAVKQATEALEVAGLRGYDNRAEGEYEIEWVLEHPRWQGFMATISLTTHPDDPHVGAVTIAVRDNAQPVMYGSAPHRIRWRDAEYVLADGELTADEPWTPGARVAHARSSDMNKQAPEQITYRGATYERVAQEGYDEADLKEFCRAYVEAALWTAIGPDYTLGPGPGEEVEHGSSEWEEAMDEITVDGLLDAGYGPDDVAPDCRKAMEDVCRKFLNRFGAELNALDESPTQYSVLEQAGHDLFLTRHGHGVGFWDRDWPEPLKTQMEQAAQASGYHETSMYVDQDGVVNCDAF